MDSGTQVYRAYVSGWDSRFTSWVDEGTVTELSRDGIPLVDCGGTLTPLTHRWVATRREAKEQIRVGLIRFIGTMQAKADALADEILHDTLTTEEVPHGVA